MKVFVKNGFNYLLPETEADLAAIAAINAETEAESPLPFGFLPPGFAEAVD